jgi:hypothetical protein
MIKTQRSKNSIQLIVAIICSNLLLLILISTINRSDQKGPPPSPPLREKIRVELPLTILIPLGPSNLRKEVAIYEQKSHQWITNGWIVPSDRGEYREESDNGQLYQVELPSSTPTKKLFQLIKSDLIALPPHQPTTASNKHKVSGAIESYEITF